MECNISLKSTSWPYQSPESLYSEGGRFNLSNMSSRDSDEDFEFRVDPWALERGRNPLESMLDLKLLNPCIIDSYFEANVDDGAELVFWESLASLVKEEETLSWVKSLPDTSSLKFVHKAAYYLLPIFLLMSFWMPSFFSSTLLVVALSSRAWRRNRGEL